MTATLNSSSWDISVHDRSDQLVLVVEVKTKLNTSAEWAAQLRQNILAHGTFPHAPYFLMAFPERFYLWSEPCNVQLEQIPLSQVLPTYTIDATPVLQPYFERVGIKPGQMSGQNFELVILSWLGEILHGEEPTEDAELSRKWLIGSGLYKAMSGGKVDEAVA